MLKILKIILPFKDNFLRQSELSRALIKTTQPGTEQKDSFFLFTELAPKHIKSISCDVPFLCVQVPSAKTRNNVESKRVLLKLQD